ncbi:hypothetical protein PV325_001321 [Microctonus aethiopoides]|uniref:Enoyl reductase (ER) domain-containing protein n=1 Tax=Microctonus aethiopoides TaxID=144406 RepID=A0AA39KW70_9HYME|nr:hypothetical protein PV325_001321 [Microctonus aethiopoides]KAK0176198.1 hypothetical protein PV328_000356 [Microctonus aethiopoides]
MSRFGRRILMNSCTIVRRKSIFSVNIPRFNGAAAKASTSSDDTKLVIPAHVPGMIQAAVLKKTDDPLVIENIEPPNSLDSNEVLIDVHYCALNGSDVLLMRESQSHQLILPKILGFEFAGKLSKVGDDAAKKGFKVGDKVVALNKSNHGGLAQQCKAEMSDVWKIPSATKMLDTVCLLNDYLTALVGLEKKAELQENELVLINVGLGGIGLAAVDIAANVFKAQVIGVSLSENRTALIRDKGAFASLRYKDTKLVKKIEEFAAERDIKDVFDGVEGEKFKKMLDSFTSIYKEEYRSNLLRDDNFAVLVEHLSRKGRLIVAGSAMTKSDNVEDKSSQSPFTITGINLEEYRRKHPESYREAGNDVLQYHEEGLIKPSYSLIAGLYKINDAIKFISDLKSSEKVIIDIKNPNSETTYREKEQ